MASAQAAAGGRGGLGWLILVVALAVPGVLFYNWWSHLKAEREKAVAVKARGRIPDGGVFQTSPSFSKLVNPMTTAVPISAVPTPVFPAASTPAVALAAASVPAPETSGQELPAGWSISTAAVEVAAAPGLKRDPMLSPLDSRHLKQEDDRRRAQAALDAERKGARRRVPAPETLIALQGIISTSEGESKAIINNEVVGVGEAVGKFRVLRITAAGVTFEYKGRRFTKSVNRD